MSVHYEIVLSCFLRDDTPDHVLDLLRWHLELLDDHPDEEADEDEDEVPLFAPDPDSPLPGGAFAELRRQRRGSDADGDIHAWGVYARTYALDDDLGEFFSLFELVAPHVADDGYGGHVRDWLDSTLSLVTFGGGAFVLEQQ